MYTISHCSKRKIINNKKKSDRKKNSQGKQIDLFGGNLNVDRSFGSAAQMATDKV